MIARLHRHLIQTVMRAADRGQPLARWIVERETRRAYSEIPIPSPIVRGQFLIPDLSQPFGDDDDDFMGDPLRVPLEPRPVLAETVVGQRVEDLSCMLGSYGAGGYGFFGLMLGDGWLILPIIGAAEWLMLDDRILESPVDRDAWIKEGDDSALLRRLTGSRITEADFRRHGLTLKFDNGAVLRIDDAPSSRAPLPENGKPRAFPADDNLAEAIFLSPSGELYL
ncbi:hypothetical protein KUV73_23920 [Mameliella alba]|nr:hypothetical protein [Mameliella alba]MBY6172423.1 hypothetical protein [Mameliella alba]MBY6177437.1 hypothetical protein [Mameliella alba]